MFLRRQFSTVPHLHEAIYEMAHFELALFFVPDLYRTLILPAPRTPTLSKSEGIVLLLLLPQLLLLRLSGSHAQPYPSVDPETTLGVCYLEKEKFRKRPFTVLAISHKGRMLDENCAESWDVGHRSISTWGSASSSCDSPDFIGGPIAGSNDRPEQLRTVDRAQRVLVWVDYGYYGDTLLEDTSPWVPNKYSDNNNRKKRDEEIARVVESVSALSLSSPSSSIRHRSSRGPGAGGSGAGMKRDVSRISQDHTGNSGTAPNEHTQKRSRQFEDGSNGGGGNSGPIGVPTSGNEGKKLCPLPKECPKARFKTNSEVIQHIAAKHRDKCCPVCEEKLVQVGGDWVYRGNSKDKIVFSTAVDMKWHIHRIHLRPYKCPVCNERYDKRGLRKHLGLYKGGNSTHAPEEYDRNSIEAVLSGSGHSNLDYPELESLVQRFDGVHTKDQMKDFLYPRPNRVKIYDCEDRNNIIDRLKGPPETYPVQPLEPLYPVPFPPPQSPFLGDNFDWESLLQQPPPGDSSNWPAVSPMASINTVDDHDVGIVPTSHDSHPSRFPALNPQPATPLMSIGDIKAKHGLTNEEIDSLGWSIIEKLPKFVHMLEEIFNSADPRGNISAAKTLAKIMQSEASYQPPPAPPQVPQATFNDLFSNHEFPAPLLPPYSYGTGDIDDSAYDTLPK
ncbi:hypothetical protein K440DRAFT_281835 [Wilcoxina mikolae CBS 423.85]|nr:hypothetical protein K440DRAFT_281835 [Wilcoxina mikolae CBS 423.85]